MRFLNQEGLLDTESVLSGLKGSYPLSLSLGDCIIGSRNL